MPDLLQTLHKYDLGHLKILAESLALDVNAREANSLADDVHQALLDLGTVRDTIDILSADARAALSALVQARGKIEWSVFARSYGEIREMGAARRDREQPQRNPASASELLFYRGLLAKAFFDSEKGAQEYAYIPSDLLPLLSSVTAKYPQSTQRVKGAPAAEPVLGRAATITEYTETLPADDSVLDDATSCLAALRAGDSEFKPDARLDALLVSAKLLKNDVPQTQAVKIFLEASRAQALELLYRAWVDSHTYDELRLLPALRCEGEWTNSPRETRRLLLGYLAALPRDKWWNLAAFLRDLKARHPDFQRPAGEYDSWFIKREADGQYLRGFASWDEVDGAVAQAVVEMLHLLGRTDVARLNASATISAFRMSRARANAPEGGRLVIASSGRLTAPPYFPRAVRYQLARFCEREAEKNGEHRYVVSARSLQRAAKQNLTAAQLLSLLSKHSDAKVPPALVNALKRWETNGSEARVENVSLLRVSRPEVLEELRNSKAAKFLGESLGPTAVVVKSGAMDKVRAALAELGLFAEIVS